MENNLFLLKALLWKLGGTNRVPESDYIWVDLGRSEMSYESPAGKYTNL